MHLSFGYIYASTVSLYVHAMNYTETEEIKNEALGQRKWNIYSTSDDSNSKKKNPDKNLPEKLHKTKGKCQFSRLKPMPLHDTPEEKSQCWKEVFKAAS